MPILLRFCRYQLCLLLQLSFLTGAPGGAGSTSLGHSVTFSVHLFHLWRRRRWGDNQQLYLRRLRTAYSSALIFFSHSRARSPLHRTPRRGWEAAGLVAPNVTICVRETPQDHSKIYFFVPLVWFGVRHRQGPNTHKALPTNKKFLFVLMYRCRQKPLLTDNLTTFGWKSAQKIDCLIVIWRDEHQILRYAKDCRNLSNQRYKVIVVDATSARAANRFIRPKTTGLWSTIVILPSASLLNFWSIESSIVMILDRSHQK